MARLARITVPGLPYHVTQRGNGRQKVFFSDADYALYRSLLAKHCRAAEVEVWAWCLMPNHVHLLLTPRDEDGPRSALFKTHRTYAGIIHAREGRSGHFWQGRFGSVALDEDHLLNAFRYLALNPVRARLVRNPEDWPWASTRAFLSGEDDGVTQRAPMLTRFPDMGGMFENEQPRDIAAFDRLRRAETIGRPLAARRLWKRLRSGLGGHLPPQSPVQKSGAATRIPETVRAIAETSRSIAERSAKQLPAQSPQFYRPRHSCKLKRHAPPQNCGDCAPNFPRRTLPPRTKLGCNWVHCHRNSIPVCPPLHNPQPSPTLNPGAMQRGV